VLRLQGREIEAVVDGEGMSGQYVRDVNDRQTRIGLFGERDGALQRLHRRLGEHDWTQDTLDGDRRLAA
jgi:hypothetical protein